MSRSSIRRRVRRWLGLPNRVGYKVHAHTPDQQHPAWARYIGAAPGRETRQP